MITSDTTIHVQPGFFGERDRPLVHSGELCATAFRFDSGVCGLQLSNELGHLIMLPFQGQQIWSAEFGGRNLTMKSMFEEPQPTRQYLDTYGAFLIHCGATAMGVPSAEDTHPLHGELPNAPYQEAHLVLGADERGPYIGLGGTYRHTVAFNHNYIARPLVKLYAGATMFSISMTMTNLKQSEMEWMYLAHINYSPMDNARLVYSATCSPEHVRVRKTVPSHVKTGPGYREFLEELSTNPAKHNVLTPDLVFDPEVCLYIDYKADAEGWAHSMQVHADGSADYVKHRPSQLEKGIRWICRTADQAALGIVLPATAEPDGYLAEKEKGNIKVLPPQAEVTLDMEAGVLNPDEAQQVEASIGTLTAAQ